MEQLWSKTQQTLLQELGSWTHRGGEGGGRIACVPLQWHAATWAWWRAKRWRRQRRKWWWWRRCRSRWGSSARAVSSSLPQCLPPPPGWSQEPRAGSCPRPSYWSCQNPPVRPSHRRSSAAAARAAIPASRWSWCWRVPTLWKLAWSACAMDSLMGSPWRSFATASPRLALSRATAIAQSRPDAHAAVTWVEMPPNCHRSRKMPAFSHISTWWWCLRGYCCT